MNKTILNTLININGIEFYYHQVKSVTPISTERCKVTFSKEFNGSNIIEFPISANEFKDAMLTQQLAPIKEEVEQAIDKAFAEIKENSI